MSKAKTYQVILNEDGNEVERLKEDARREKNWKRWGPYLSERQWGTVREDYSPNGEWYAACVFILLLLNIVTYYYQCIN